MKKTETKKGPLILLMIDGFGVAPKSEGNAIAMAGTPHLDELISKYPSTALSLPSMGRGKKIDQRRLYSIIGGAGPHSDSLLDRLSAEGKKWCVLAEPERIALSSYFFNGGKKIPPQSCFLPDRGSEPLKNFLEISNELIKRIKAGHWDFIAVFMADLESISRDKDLKTLLLAIKEIDRTIAKLSKVVLERNGCLVLSAGNGLAEKFIDMKTGEIDTALSLNPVPFVLIGNEFEGKTMDLPEAPNGDLSNCAPGGTLLDIAPTIIKLMDLPVKNKQQGHSLF